MASLKNNINNISDDTENLVKNYIKLFSVKQTEKFALFLGILASVFILLILIIIVIVFYSHALVTYLNDILAGDYWGYWIISGFYILLITILIIKMAKTHKPLFANFFVKFIMSVFNLDMDQSKSVQGLKFESEMLKHNIESDKDKIKTDVQMLRYVIMESFFREFFGLFSSNKKSEASDDAESDQASDKKDKD